MDYGRINISFDDYKKPDPIRNKMGKKSVVELLLVTSVIGLAILGFRYSVDWIVDLVLQSKLMDYYKDSFVLQEIIQIFFSIFGIMLPFGIAIPFIKLIQPKTSIIPLDKPKSMGYFKASIPIAFVILILANFVTAVMFVAIEGIGFSFDESEVESPSNVFEFIWEWIAVALIPALCEEFAIRGVVLQSLRKYGDIFAIVISAFLFGVMHGNVTQIPFAFILGCAMGYFVIKTGSLWTSIAIHLMNNTYAIIISILTNNLPMVGYLAIAATINAIGMAIGLLSYVWIRKNKMDTNPVKDKYVRWQPFVVTILSPVLIWAIVEVLKVALGTVSYMG